MMKLNKTSIMKGKKKKRGSPKRSFLYPKKLKKALFIFFQLFSEDSEDNYVQIQVQHRSPVARGIGVAAAATTGGAATTAAPGGVVNQFKPTNPQDAARAMEMLDFTPVNGKPIRVKNLHKSFDNEASHDTFSSFGHILTDSNGQSKCYGFVQFDNDESAQSSIDKLNGVLINGKQVYVAHALRKEKSGRAQAEEGQLVGERPPVRKQ
ncbi:polyadenylate-binding protein 4-like [Solanum dulcamara]|uniref:polyadenylate-binding protein 4-like n=1 Tax=Solanum dulcamara TaxID=45834 RepID=UPI00248520A4|nr:polyadenylate-binding protein 4-like [Solanum dulcamara]